MHRSLPAASAAAVALIATLLAPAGAAQAAVPDSGSFSSRNVFTDSEVCAAEGFAVDVVETETDRWKVYFDADGGFARALVHIDYATVATANGRTITERDRWQDFYYPDGSYRKAGLTVHIQGPGGGLVQRDAGQIGFNPDGSAAYLRGPHPQFEGQTFCFALLP